ncbi:MAG: hypothetical protein PHQ41_03415 [Candidatus Cloacimonetes bacterium]|jgi:Zn ribbon nucleic-acid-binding protein|nr:hypothetical protein [Candidatus Cloacimonadota bacterium]
MAKKNGFELIQGKGNQVHFDTECPKCKYLVKAVVWIENNSFLKQIQCPICGYDKLTGTKLVEDGLSEIDANIKIKMKLFENTQKNNPDLAMLIWYSEHVL